MGLGEKPTAFKLIEREMAAIPCGGALVPVLLTPALLRLDPMFDPLRSDPCFQKLCEEKTKTPDK